MRRGLSALCAALFAAIFLAGCSAGDEALSVESSAESSVQETAENGSAGEVIRVGSLKGPTTIGLLNMMEDVSDSTGSSENGAQYTFRMETDASALAALVISGDIDIALLPANLASVLYNKTEGGVVALNINTLGVLECVSGDESINHIADLSGKTVLSTGQGATPEYALRYLFNQNAIDGEIEFVSEATEAAARLAEDPSLTAVLPQPFATSAVMQNDALSRRFSLTDEWNNITDESTLVTGVTIVRAEVLEEIGEDAVREFMNLQSESMAAALSDIDHTASLAEEQGIIASAEVAKAALPYCGVPTDEAGEGYAITGEEMKTLLSGYLETLYELDQSAVGGTLPDDEFFYLND